MALPDYVNVATGTLIVLANTGEYSSTVGLPARTDQIDLGALANGDLRQSAKFDLGANRAPYYAVFAAIEWHSAPSADQLVNFAIGFSNSGTAANGNPAGLSGSDAAYVGYGAAAADGREAFKQLDTVGSVVTTADAAIQVAQVGGFVAKDRYGMMVVWNASGVTIANTDAIETAVIIVPLRYPITDS